MNASGSLPTLGEVAETLTLRAGFNTNTVILGTTTLGLAAGVIGVFALLRKRSLVTDALSHATLPGIALAYLAALALGVSGRSLPVLLAGAAASGVVGVLGIQAILRFTRLREDAAIGIVLSVFFGAGVVGLSYIQANAPGQSAGLDAFIYGQTAAMLPRDAALMAGIAALALAASLLLLKEFAVVCFNDSFARATGWPVSAVDLLMMALVVLVTVAGLQAVGLILVVAMLIIPAVSARLWTDRLWLLVVLGGGIGALSGYAGAAVSALLPNKPAGSVIVLTSGALFAVSLLAAPSRGVLATALRRFRLRLRFACDHLLEAGHERRASGEAGTLAADASRVGRQRGWSAPFRFLVLLTLRRGGHARAEGGALRLSEDGARRGARVSRNHRLWEQYLVSAADVAPSHVDWSVDQVEHVLSEQQIRELERELAARGIVVPPPAGAGSEPA